MYQFGIVIEDLAIPQTFIEATKEAFDAQYWNEAIETELKILLQNKVLDDELVTKEDIGKLSGSSVQILVGQWMFGVLQDFDHHIDRFVAQLVIDDTGDQPQMAPLSLPKIQFPTIRLALLWALKLDFSVKKFKIKTTFFGDGDCESSNKSVYLKMPGAENQYRKLHKQLHPLSTMLNNPNPKSKSKTSKIEANQDNFLKNVLQNAKFVQCLMDQSLYFHQNGTTFLIVYFDEMLVFGDSSLVEQALRDKLIWFENCNKINKKNPQKFCGVTIECTDNKEFQLSQMDFIEILSKQYQKELKTNTDQPNKANKSNKQQQGDISKSVKEYNLSEDGEVNPDHQMRPLINELFYVATRTRPDLMSAVAFLRLNQQNPTEELWQKAIQILENLIRYKTRKHCLGKFRNDTPELVIWTDASFGTENVNKNINNDGRCLGGVISQWYGSTVTWQSLKQQIVSYNVVDAELYAIYDGVNTGLVLTKLIQIFHNRLVLKISDGQKENEPTSTTSSNKKKFKLWCDNMSAVVLVMAGLNETYLYLDEQRIDHVRTQYCEGHFEIDYVESKKNLADFLTKPAKMPKEVIDGSRQILMDHKILATSTETTATQD